MMRDEERPGRPWYTSEPIHRPKDIAMLGALLKPGTRIWPTEREAFKDMATTLKENPRRELSFGQRRWVAKAYARIGGS